MGRVGFILAFVCPSLCLATTLGWNDLRDDPSQPSDESAVATVMDSAQNVYVTGNGQGIKNIQTIKYDSGGVVQWSTTFLGASNAINQAHLISLDPMGNVIVVGTTEDSPSSRKDIVVLKYSGTTGLPLWSQAFRYDGRAHHDDVPIKVLIDLFGDIYIGAQLQDWGPFFRNDIAIIKISGATGVHDWHRRIRGTIPTFSSFKVEDHLGDMALTPSGHLIIVGSRMPGDYPTSGVFYALPWLLKLSVTNQTLVNLSGVIPYTYAGLNGVSVDPVSGNYAVTGIVHSGSDNDMFTASFSATDFMQWWSSFDPGSQLHEWGEKVALAPNGDVAVVSSETSFSTKEWLLFFYHFTTPPPLGSQVMPQWGRFFTAGSLSSEPKLFSIQISSSPQLIIHGAAMPSSQSVMRMVDLRYSTAGILVPGGPAYSQFSVTADDVLSCAATDLSTGQSVMVGSAQMQETTGAGSLFSDWAVQRTGP